MLKELLDFFWTFRAFLVESVIEKTRIFNEICVRAQNRPQFYHLQKNNNAYLYIKNADSRQLLCCWTHFYIFVFADSLVHRIQWNHLLKLMCSNISITPNIIIAGKCFNYGLRIDIHVCDLKCKYFVFSWTIFYQSRM